MRDCGINTTASNDHDGQQLISHLEGGLNFALGRVTLRPFDSLDWIVQREDAFRETGAGPYDLDVDKSHANMFRNELGLNVATCGYFANAKMSADVKASWVRENRISGSEFTSVFTDTSIPFTVNGYFPNRNLFSCGGSVTAVILQELVSCKSYRNGVYDQDYLGRGDVLSITAYYNGVFGSKYMDNSVGVQANFSF